MATELDSSTALFSTRGAYMGVLIAYFVTVALMFRSYEKLQKALADAPRNPSIIKVAVAIVCAGIFLSMLRRTRSIVERSVLILSAVFFALWATETIAGFGYQILSIAQVVSISLMISIVATALLGFRLFQVWK